MLGELLNPENFGSFILEITSWENDGDNYQTNHEFEKESTRALERYEYLCKAAKGQPFVIAGTKFNNLQEVLDSEVKDSEGYHISDYISDYILDSIGREYGSDTVRTVESVKLYFLDEDGSLNHVFVDIG